jgi:hypothetical protein
MFARDALNRFLTFITGTAVAVAGAVTLLVVTNAVKTGTLAPSEWFRDQFALLDGLAGTDETIAIIAAAAALAVGALIVVIELAPSVRRERELTVRDESGNTLALAPESVSLVAEQSAREVVGVLNADMHVRDNHDGVIVDGDVVLLEDANVAEKTAEISQRVRSALEERMGVKVVRMAMKMRLANAAEAEKAMRHNRDKYPYRERAGTTHN